MTAVLNTLESVESRAGNRINRVTSLDELIHKSQFDFSVEKASLYDPEGRELPNTFMLRRTDNHKPLNVVRGRYRIVSNEEMLRPFHEMVQAHGATYESSGMVGDGRICWVSARLPQDLSAGDGDVLEQRILALMYHDGTRRNSYFEFTNRVWCNNQMRALNKAARAGHTVGHTTNWQQQLEQARGSFQQAIQSGQAFQKQVTRLTSRKMTDNQAECFLQHMFPVNKDTSDRSRTRTTNIRNTVHELFHSGAGNSGDTRWDMLNAVTEYYDHHRKSKSRNSGKQFINDMTGMGSTPHKNRAMRLLLKNSKFVAIDPSRN